MADNSDLLALLGDLLRATDRQTEANKHAIDELREEVRRNSEEMRQEMRRTSQETNDRFEAMFNRFAIAVADGFIRSEKKLDAVKQEVAGVRQEVAGVKQEVAGVKQEVGALRQDVQRMDERMEQNENSQPTLRDIIHRLTVVETIVLPKAS